MPTLTIRHLTTYRYLRPVAFGEHRMMLRPRDSHDQRVMARRQSRSLSPQLLPAARDAVRAVGRQQTPGIGHLRS
jgi:hypothetical protein